MKYAIETNDLTKKYDDFLAVDTLNMKVKNKSIFGFLGPNGAGKTTSIKMLTCLIQPTSGTASVSGFNINKDPNEVREKIGMVPQLVSLYSDLTARENVQLCADYYGVPEDEREDRIDDLMELVDIKYAEKKLIKQMSGGQKQKVSVVASLIHRPDILFLDEPTIGLDPTTKMVLWDLIQELNDNGHTIILCSHDMYEVEKLCENIGIMNHGKLVAYDTPRKLKDQLMKEKEERFVHSNPLLNQLKDNLSQSNTEDGKLDIHPLGDEDKLRDINKIKEELDVYVPTTTLSIMADNLNDKVLGEINSLEYVYSAKIEYGDRISVDIDQISDKSGINKVVEVILKNGATINSIATDDPSLEDVFVNLTSKKYNPPPVDI